MNMEGLIDLDKRISLVAGMPNRALELIQRRLREICDLHALRILSEFDRLRDRGQRSL